MPLYDFQCVKGHEFEEISAVNAPMTCPKCGEKAVRIWRKVAKCLVEFIPDYPGSKRFKAGYTHTSHADHPATKVQSGYGGMCNPPV